MRMVRKEGAKLSSFCGRESSPLVERLTCPPLVNVLDRGVLHLELVASLSCGFLFFALGPCIRGVGKREDPSHRGRMLERPLQGSILFVLTRS